MVLAARLKPRRPSGEYNRGILKNFNPMTLAEIEAFGRVFCYLTDSLHTRGRLAGSKSGK
jgi:hypothetical protein